MYEQYVQVEIAEPRNEATHPQHSKVDEQQQRVLSEPQKAPYDFTHSDFSRPEIRRRLGRAYAILIERAKRRVQTSDE
jgi:hypothetical protein